jgi:hypothetical protein
MPMWLCSSSFKTKTLAATYVRWIEKASFTFDGAMQAAFI